MSIQSDEVQTSLEIPHTDLPPLNGVLPNGRSKYLELIVDQRNKARHWRFCHYEAATYYQKFDTWLGLPTVILATIILGFAFYAVDRSDTALWTQITLASLTVIQGVFLVVQLYLKPNTKAESHRHSAVNLGILGRKWAALQARVENGDDFNPALIEETMSVQDNISRESHPVPSAIIKKNGHRPKLNKKAE